jgi:hypothetical protein
VSYPRFQAARAFKKVRRATGTNMALANVGTTWTDLATATNGPGAAGFDLTLSAQVGDEIEVCPSWGTGAEAFIPYFDVATVVSAAIVNAISSGVAPSTSGFGVYAWAGFNGANGRSTGGHLYTVQAGDLASGLITLRPIYRCTGVKTVYSDATLPFMFYAKNLGPADPN